MNKLPSLVHKSKLFELKNYEIAIYYYTRGINYLIKRAISYLGKMAFTL